MRPEVRALFARWQHVVIGLAAAAFGVWLLSLRGPLMTGLGTVIGLGGVIYAWGALRRLRFQLDVDAPGIVELDEGRISYFGPVMGGSLALSELTEVQVLNVAGSRLCWRLKQVDGQSLLVPLAASGADQLYDALTALPGMDGRALDSALAHRSSEPKSLWRRAAP